MGDEILLNTYVTFMDMAVVGKPSFEVEFGLWYLALKSYFWKTS